MKKTADYHEYLIRTLKDPNEAVGYLNAAIKEGEKETLLLALRDVAEAQGGVGKIARKAKLNRVSLYRIFSRKGNPEIASLERILEAMGMSLAIVRTTHPKPPKRKPKKGSNKKAA